MLCRLLEAAELWSAEDGHCTVCHESYDSGSYKRGYVLLIAGCNVWMCCSVDDALREGRLTHDQILRVIHTHYEEFPDAR